MCEQAHSAQQRTPLATHVGKALGDADLPAFLQHSVCRLDLHKEMAALVVVALVHVEDIAHLARERGEEEVTAA